tara:strand:- start:1448 stop:1630 length:183 start_codon:yes stop_codon:yes gene_type:complete
MDWNDSADRWALAEWVISTWTDDELREYAIGTVLAKYLLDPGQFEGDLELKKAEEEEEER